jgi:hypothetical protein
VKSKDPDLIDTLKCNIRIVTAENADNAFVGIGAFDCVTASQSEAVSSLRMTMAWSSAFPRIQWASPLSQPDSG